MPAADASAVGPALPLGVPQAGGWGAVGSPGERVPRGQPLGPGARLGGAAAAAGGWCGRCRGPGGLDAPWGGGGDYSFDQFMGDVLDGEYGDIFYAKDEDGREYMIDQTGTISLKYFDLAERPADDAPVDDLNGFIVVPTGDVVRITEDASTDEGFREEAVGVCKRTLRGSGALPLYDLECKVGEQDYSIKMIDSSNITGRSFQDLGRGLGGP